LAEIRAAAEARARRERRRAVWRRLRPRRPDRRVGRLFARRSRPQRAAIGTVGAVLVGLVWLLADSLATKVAVTVLIALAAPAAIVLTFDRRM
jgi:predicted small integral membrane protein